MPPADWASSVVYLRLRAVKDQGTGKDLYQQQLLGFPGFAVRTDRMTYEQALHLRTLCRRKQPRLPD